MSVAATMSRGRSVVGEMDTTGGLNDADNVGNAATVMHASAQLMANDFAGQHGHFGACLPWLMDEWQ